MKIMENHALIKVMFAFFHDSCPMFIEG